MLPDYSRDFNLNGPINTTNRWSDLNGNRDYDAGELGQCVSATGGSNRVLNPDLGQPKTDELTATYEQEVANQFSARVSYVFKRNFGEYQSVNITRPFDVYNSRHSPPAPRTK